MCLVASLLGCGGSGGESSSTSASSVCVAGDTVFNGIPEDQIDDVIESAQGEDIRIDENVSLDQSSALKLFKVTIIGSCNDVHTEDNDTTTTSDDDTNIQLGQQTQ